MATLGSMKKAIEKRGAAKPSLHDVARKAGVSPASVSRVLNDVQPISERLRRSVDEAVRSLGYVPKNPQTSRGSSILAVFTADLLNPVFNEIIAGIEDRAAAHGVASLLLDLRGGRAVWETVKNSFTVLKPRGYIVLGTLLNEQTLSEFAIQGKVPLVVVNQVIRHPSIRSINIDHAKATYSAAVHLMKLRHRRIAFLGGSASSLVNNDKIRGAENALREGGLELAAENVITGAPTVEWGFQATNSLLGRPPERRPTAVMCACDLIALGALHAVRSAGLSVPRDISVVGFDDINMACHSNPALTTISPPKFEMGALAVDLLLPRVEDSSRITDYVMIESPLVVRESTAECCDVQERII
jgi:DNA-binding LacI/PurR family transcriptional regulator